MRAVKLEASHVNNMKCDIQQRVLDLVSSHRGSSSSALIPLLGFECSRCSLDQGPLNLADSMLDLRLKRNVSFYNRELQEE